MSEPDVTDPAVADGAELQPEPVQRQKSLTIGAVCKALQQEFPDISISKIRYLEDQKLLTPRRTPGGYRLYSQTDVSRLRTILRLQRDEFLPLRVIRQELAAGRSEGAEQVASPQAGSDARPGAALRRLTFTLRDKGALYSLEDVVEETGAERQPRAGGGAGSGHRAPGRGAAPADVLDPRPGRVVLARGRDRGDRRRSAADP